MRPTIGSRRESTVRKVRIKECTAWRLLAILAVACAVVGLTCSAALASQTGAIFTTEACNDAGATPHTCSGQSPAVYAGDIIDASVQKWIVDANLYPSKLAVFLNGGPQNINDAGLPAGIYIFMVTEPSAGVPEVLLSADAAKCRQVVVGADANGHGVVQGTYKDGVPSDCWHTTIGPDTATDGLPVQLMPYLDTRNNGGVYKAWLVSKANFLANGGDLECVPHPNVRRHWSQTVDDHPGNAGCIRDTLRVFANSDTKTDNFKVRQTSVSTQVDFGPNAGVEGNCDTFNPLCFIDGWKLADEYTVGQLPSTALPLYVHEDTCVIQGRRPVSKGFVKVFSYSGTGALNCSIETLQTESGYIPLDPTSGCVDYDPLLLEPGKTGNVATAHGEFGYRACYYTNNDGTGTETCDVLGPLENGCEPWKVIQGIEVETHIKDSNGYDVTGKRVPVGTIVHDEADLWGELWEPATIPESSFVTFCRYAGNECSGEPLFCEDVSVAGETPMPGVVGPTPYTMSATDFPAGISYTAQFTSGDPDVVLDSRDVECYEWVGVCVTNLTPGYWKNHLARENSPGCDGLPSGTGCSNNGPWASQYLPQNLGSYLVTTIQKAADVFVGMNCGSSTAQDAIGCLAGHLLAAKFNVANNGGASIPENAAADALLATVGYSGPAGSYSLTASQRAQAISLKTALDTFNNLTCPQ